MSSISAVMLNAVTKAMMKASVWFSSNDLPPMKPSSAAVSPDDGGDRDPAHEPAPWLARDTARQGEGSASTWNEACGNQQQTTALMHLLDDLGHSFRTLLGARLTPHHPVACFSPDEITEVVTDECTRDPADDDEWKPQLAKTGTYPANDDERFARHDGQN